jgi:hypothetical protein
MRYFIQSIVTVLLMVVSLVALAGGPDVQPPPKPISYFQISPYAWIFGTNGNLTANGVSSHLNNAPFENYHNISSFFQVPIEFGYGRWAFMVNPAYLKAKQSATVNGTSATATPGLFVLDFGAYFNVASVNIPTLASPEGSIFHFQLFAGGRYANMKVKIYPPAAATVSASRDFIVPMIGLRIIAELSQPFHLELSGDFGGFGVSHTSDTWSASLIAKYFFCHYFALAAGFRALGIDYSKGTGTNRFVMNTTSWGPLVGLVFRFSS